MKDYTNITPRMYAAHHRSPAFGGRELPPDNVPGWRKIGRGLIAAHDGGKDAMRVRPGHVYAVEIHNGVIGIASYRTRSSRPYTISTAKLMAATQQWTRDRWPMTYDEMADAVRAAYPGLDVPGPKKWYAEYGIDYDEATGATSNSLGLMEESD